MVQLMPVIVLRVLIVVVEHKLRHSTFKGVKLGDWALPRLLVTLTMSGL